jgi:lipoyl-dependent peroxiredoxin
MESSGRAEWKGGLKDGQGLLSANSGVLADVPYSFVTRFETPGGTNPEELIATAHAACFSMALSAQLEAAGHKPESVKTTATVVMEKVEGGFGVTKVRLQTVVSAPGIDEAAFRSAAEGAKSGCPVTKLLNAEITLDAQLA